MSNDKFPKKQIKRYCKKHNMTVHFTDTQIFIITPFGSWYIDTEEEPIKLYHANTSARYASKKSFMDQYHSQNKTFSTWKHVLGYIRAHDFNKIKRDLERQKKEDIFKAINNAG